LVTIGSMRIQSTYTFAFIVISIAAFLGLGCNKNGDAPVTRTIQGVTGYHTINIDGGFKVVLIQDSLGYVEFYGVEKHLNTCVATVTDSVLSLDGNHRGEFLHPGEPATEVRVHCSSLKLINANDDCSLRSELLNGSEIGVVVGCRSFEGNLNLNCNTFYYWNNPGGSNVTLSGNVTVLKYWTVGLSTLDAKNLVADYVLVSHGSQNVIQVSPVQTLEYSITNIGDLIYYGNPPQIVPVLLTGTGELINGN